MLRFISVLFANLYSTAWINQSTNNNLWPASSQFFFSFWFKSPKKVPNHDPEHYPPKKKMLGIVSGMFLRDWSQPKNLFEIKPHLAGPHWAEDSNLFLDQYVFSFFRLIVQTVNWAKTKYSTCTQWFFQWATQKFLLIKYFESLIKTAMEL